MQENKAKGQASANSSIVFGAGELSKPNPQGAVNFSPVCVGKAYKLVRLLSPCCLFSIKIDRA